MCNITQAQDKNSKIKKSKSHFLDEKLDKVGKCPKIIQPVSIREGLEIA